jgi:hypothetical protein
VLPLSISTGRREHAIDPKATMKRVMCAICAVAKSRKVSVTKLIEEMTTILLADFDAETRFELRAARGRGRLADGLALLDKAAGKRSRSKRGS